MNSLLNAVRMDLLNPKTLYGARKFAPKGSRGRPIWRCGANSPGKENISRGICPPL